MASIPDSIGTPITAAQSRAARALLNLKQSELAYLAGVNRQVIIRFEAGETTPRPVTLERLVGAFAQLGVEFLESPTLVVVQMRKKASSTDR